MEVYLPWSVCHFTITLIPLTLLRCVNEAILADDAACTEVIGKGEDDIGEFEGWLQFPALRTEQTLALHRLIPIDSSHDVATHRPRGITVTVMVDSCDDSFFHAVNMPDGTVKGNSPGFFACPPLAEEADIFCIALVVGGKRHGLSFLGDTDHEASGTAYRRLCQEPCHESHGRWQRPPIRTIPYAFASPC